MEIVFFLYPSSPRLFDIYKITILRLFLDLSRHQSVDKIVKNLSSKNNLFKRFDTNNGKKLITNRCQINYLNNFSNEINFLRRKKRTDFL